jgi:hypothetical protein
MHFAPSLLSTMFLRKQSLRSGGLSPGFNSVVSNPHFIRASEIGEWCFCKRAWYLSGRGADPSLVQVEKRTSGARYHAQHAHNVQRARALLSAATYTLLFALLVAAAYLFLTDAR